MAEITQMTTTEAVAYLGIGRSTFKRYEGAGRIKPSAIRGQTNLYALADLNAIRSEITQKQVTVQGAARPGSAGKIKSEQHEEAMAKMAELSPDGVIVDIAALVGDGPINPKMLERAVADGFRSKIATVLDKTNAINIVAADLYSPVAKDRRDAFQLLAKFFLPSLQALSVEKVGQEKVDVGAKHIQEALDRIRLAESKQRAIEGPPMIVLEGEISE